MELVVAESYGEVRFAGVDIVVGVGFADVGCRRQVASGDVV